MRLSASSDRANWPSAAAAEARPPAASANASSAARSAQAAERREDLRGGTLDGAARAGVRPRGRGRALRAGLGAGPVLLQEDVGVRRAEGPRLRERDDAGQARHDAERLLVQAQRARRLPRPLPVERLRVARDRHELAATQQGVPLHAQHRVLDKGPERPERVAREPVVGVERRREDVVRGHVGPQQLEAERQGAPGAQVPRIHRRGERHQAEVLPPPVRGQ
jgi:hypothetical protein